ncbi:MAG TPA: DUF3303 family protein [Dehalococcoidia bacterium]|nr:DUF3303 family protein [Dehalococcoidia bacterium]
MLWMSIFTYEPEKRDEVVKRRLEIGTGLPQGLKLIGEWTDLTGGRNFTLTEGPDDPKLMLAAIMAWDDLGKFDNVPVMEVEEALKLVPKG